MKIQGLIWFVGFMCSLNAFGQGDPFRVSGEIKGLQGRKLGVVLAEYDHGRFVPLDSQLVTNGSFGFLVNQQNEGFYRLEWKLRKTNEIGFVLTKKGPSFEVIIDPHDPKRSELIGTPNKENKLLGQAARLKHQQKGAVRDLKESYRGLSSVDPQYYTKKAELRDSVELVRHKLNQGLKEIASENPTSFVSRFVIPLMIRPNFNDDPDYKTQYDGFTSLWHAHYFDPADLNNPGVLRSPELKDQLQDYLNEFAGKEFEDNISSIEYLMSCSSNQEVRRFMIRLCYLFFVAKEKTLVLAHIESEYFKELSKEQASGLTTKSTNLLEVSLGKEFKDFELGDCNCEFTKFKDVVKTSRSTLLLFWSYECGSCEKELDDVKLLYQEFKSKGLEIVAVNVNSDKEKWRQTVEERGYDWIQLHEPAGFKGMVPKLYSVQKTPTSYLVIHNGIIKGHDQSAVELRALFSVALK